MDLLKPEERANFAQKAFGSNLRFWIVNEQAIRQFYDDDRNIQMDREAALQRAAALVAESKTAVVIWERIAVLRPQVSVELQTPDGATEILQRGESEGTFALPASMRALEGGKE